MSNPRDDSAEQPFQERKIRERALLLPLVGLMLLVPPIVNIFELDWRIAGIPFTILYLFIVWALLIIGAASLAGRLREQRDSPVTTAQTKHPKYSAFD